MWDSTSDDHLGVVWETLSLEAAPLSSDALHKKTGVPLGKVLSSLRKMTEIGIVHSQAAPDNGALLWQSQKKMDPLSWARAVEIGIPLATLEKTVGLSIKDRRRAEHAASSGLIDQEQIDRRQAKIKQRETVLRGRAASRAATTDLAKLVQDIEVGLESHPSNSPVKELFRAEAMRALDALVKAMEKT